MSIDNKDIIKLQSRLKRKLSETRYAHTVSVSHTCACLAMKYDYDVNKAIIAGLLHDCAKYKYMDGEEMLNKAQKAGLPITEYELNKPDLLHAKLGSYYANKKYDINDEDILSAIECHTTGKPQMNLLEKIVYVADYIEPLRYKMPRLDVIRKLAFEDIDECLKLILSDTLKYLKSSGMMIDKATIDTYNYYCK